jgi:hypothetical protein
MMLFKRVRFPANSYTMTYTAGIFSLGLLVGSVIMFFVYGKNLQAEKSSRQALTSFNAGQSRLLSQQTVELAALRKALGPGAASSMGLPQTGARPVLAAATPDKPLAAAVKPAPQQVREVASAAPAKSMANTTPPKSPPKVVVADAAPAVPVATRPVSTQPQAVESPGPATVTFEQAGIVGIDNTSVRFKSGRQISIGGEFPSGEKLLSVNPVEGKFVTDRRTIVLAKPAAAP